MYVRTYARMYVRMYLCTYVLTHVRTHAHTQACTNRFKVGDSVIKVIELDPAPATPAAPGGIRGATGYRYWTIAVSNLVASVEKAAAAGATIVVATKEVRPGITIASIAGPDVYWFELLEESA